MSGFAVVFRREFLERRNVIFTALAASLIPILIPLLPSVPADSKAEARGVIAAILAAVFAAGVAAISGASLFSKELADGRASFLFSRPIAHAAIWGGKLLSGIALVLVTLAIILLPTVALEGRWPTGWAPENGWVAVGIAGGSLLLLFLAGNAASVMVRSRRMLVVADFVLAVIAVATGWLLLVQLALVAWGSGLGLLFLAVLASILAVGLLAGSYVQTARGRGDIGRAHRALSLTLWPVIFGAFSIIALYLAWLPRVGSEDIERVFSVRSGSNSWIVIQGSAAWRPDAYDASLLVDMDKPERYVRLDADVWPGSVQFSRDGRRAAWQTYDFNARWLFRGEARRPHRRLVIANLEGAPSVRDTDVLVDAEAIVLSDDGRRIAIWDGGQVSAYDTDSLLSLGSVKVEGDYVRMYFTQSGDLRLLANQPGESEDVTLLTWNPEKRRLAQSGIVTTARRISVDATGTKLLVVSEEALALHDASTGAQLAVLLRTDQDTEPASGRFLHDGRVVATRTSASDRLFVFAPDGQPVREVPLPAAERHAVADQLSDDEVLVRSASGSGDTRQFRTLVVNLRESRVKRVIENALPASTWEVYVTDPRISTERRPVALRDWNSGSLRRFDPETGTVVRILGVRD